MAIYHTDMKQGTVVHAYRVRSKLRSGQLLIHLVRLTPSGLWAHKSQWVDESDWMLHNPIDNAKIFSMPVIEISSNDAAMIEAISSGGIY